MKTCNGEYIYRRNKFECPVKRKCGNYSIFRRATRKATKTELVEAINGKTIPGCYAFAFEKLIGTEHEIDKY